jgi:DNA-binding GntR family transcriptional regulator
MEGAGPNSITRFTVMEIFTGEWYLMGRIENRALRDYIYEQIRDLIEEGVFPIGEKINKSELASKFGVSQTPISDALNRLVGERYLEQRQRKGYYIREFNAQEFRDFFEMRAGLEGIAVRLCCENATDSQLQEIVTSFDGFSWPMTEDEQQRYYEADRLFHVNVVRYSGNEIILQTLKTTGFQARTYQKGLVRGPGVTLHEHQSVIDAIKVRDGERAQQQMVWHLLGSRDVFKALVEKNKSGNQ